MKKSIIIYDGIARRVGFSEGVSQLKIEVIGQTVMMADGQELAQPQSTALNTMLELPLSGRDLTVSMAREMRTLQIGHRVRVTMTEYKNGIKSYNLCNMTLCYQFI